MHRAARLHAERAGQKLIQRERGRVGVDGGLALRRALLRTRTGQCVAQDNDLTQADTQGFDEHEWDSEW